jgi:hypothetical protein
MYLYFRLKPTDSKNDIRHGSKNMRVDHSFVCLKRTVFLDPNFSNDHDTMEKIRRAENLHKREQRAKFQRVIKPFIFPFVFIWDNLLSPIIRFIRYESGKLIRYYCYNILYMLPYRIFLMIIDFIRIHVQLYYDSIYRRPGLNNVSGKPVRFFRIRYIAYVLADIIPILLPIICMAIWVHVEQLDTPEQVVAAAKQLWGSIEDFCNDYYDYLISDVSKDLRPILSFVRYVFIFAKNIVLIMFQGLVYIFLGGIKLLYNFISYAYTEFYNFIFKK